MNKILNWLAPTPEEKESDESLLQGLKDLQEIRGKEEYEVEEIELEIDDNKPIGIWFIGDLHLGHKDVDYKEFEKGIKILENNESLYTIWLGDMIENYNYMSSHKHTDGSSGYEQLMSPQEQIKQMEKIVTQLEDKILTIIQGDHEAFTFEGTGIDISEYLSRLVDIPYMTHGGLLKFTVGNQSYDLQIRHKYKYYSSLNLTHSAKRLMQFEGVADVAAVGHRHEYSVEQCEFHDKDRIFMQVGSYKLKDRYSSRGGFTKIEKVTPIMVIFYPNERKIIPIQGLEVGISYLNWLRDNYEGDNA